MKESGLTLMEVTIVVAVVAMLIVAISPFIRTSYQAWDVGDRRMEVIQNARVGMDKMVSDLRQATAFNDVTDYDEDNGRIEFEILDENGVRHTRRFFSEDSWLKVWDRNEDNSTVEINDQVLAGPINTLKFTCYDENGVECNPPGTVEVDEIRSVEITIEIADEDGEISPITVTSRAFPRTKMMNPTLVIDEIMYNPSGSDAKDEWIEIYNTTSDNISMAGYQLQDGSQTDNLEGDDVNGDGSMTIPAGGYAIITDKDTEVYDGTFSPYPLLADAVRLRVDDNNIGNGLGNNGDTITLLNDVGDTVDSVAYDDSWGGDGNGESIERINPTGSSGSQSNWEDSGLVVTHTIGVQNTVTP